MADQVFQPLPTVPDHAGLEEEVLAWWEAQDIFGKLRERNRGGPTFSFIDGPVTANKPLGVHHGWGRTLKDVFQRFWALRGFDQRYQNGFDCQGLWIEVGVEHELGLNSKPEIEEYGLENFARKCRDAVVRSADEIWKGSKRLGQWMDWGNDYFTFSDTNIEYVWRMLKVVHEREWLYRGHRSTEWCPRCGTSISQHELIGSYVDRADPSLYVRFPLLDRHGEALVIWTTTPWTLPANVAAAVNPEAQYGRRANGEWVAAARYPDETFEEQKPGSDLVGWRYRGPFDDLPPGASVEHRVIPWDEVSLDDGTGVVHIAPGCGAEDFELSRVNDLPVLTPVDESGRFYDDYGWLHGLSTVEAADQIIGELGEKGVLLEAGLHEHRYPECWRCHTPLIFRLADDWFISVKDLRQPMLDANATVEWTPEYMGKRMDDWLNNMGDWNISRRRYYGLPLPFYPCACGHLNVIGSKAELQSRAMRGLDQLEELRRPWIDRVPVSCEQCGEAVERVKEVGDVWLDAGIVPFATLGWQNAERVSQGYATGAAKGLTHADLPDHAYWEKWFPADWVSEMREQIRLWFYSQLFMSVVLTGRAPFKRVLGYEKMLDETGREMHGSWGNTIPLEDAFARMGADVMRWQYCAQSPERNLLFGFGPAEEIRRELLTFWNSVSFFVAYANIRGFRPSWSELEPSGELKALDRWLIERTHAFVADATEAYERFRSDEVIALYEAYADDLSNWYIRRTRPRFWDGDDVALGTLWYALVQTLRMLSPVMPFLTDHLWRNLVPDGPESVHLAPWPEAAEPDRALLDEMQDVRRVVTLAHQARSASGLKLRQPLRTLVVEGASGARAYADEIADEVRVKDVTFDKVDAELRVKPNLPALGPRLGKELRDVQQALQAGAFEELGGGRFRAAGHELEPDEVLVERGGREGWAVAAADGVTVALETSLDDELLLEGRVLDLIRLVNTMRKEQGLELTDRIVLTVPADYAELVDRHADWIKGEVLAVELRVDGSGAVGIAKSEARE
ncbi:MAG TPA: isoleucine--tRNA ligase [Gaiellaceae bacterium]|jgi:isoleucyl-tRNA synthetase|nr:isoleucine--tRNA ligase [Gaiellaceae bacterium]